MFRLALKLGWVVSMPLTIIGLMDARVRLRDTHACRSEIAYVCLFGTPDEMDPLWERVFFGASESNLILPYFFCLHVYMLTNRMVKNNGLGFVCGCSWFVHLLDKHERAVRRNKKLINLLLIYFDPQNCVSLSRFFLFKSCRLSDQVPRFPKTRQELWLINKAYNCFSFNIKLRTERAENEKLQGFRGHKNK